MFESGQKTSRPTVMAISRLILNIIEAKNRRYLPMRAVAACECTRGSGSLRVGIRTERG